jgi:hypothetical protein
MAELGDITDFMKEGSGVGVSDLEWLAVDEQKYRAEDTLPKQNLDMVPDLNMLWDHNRDASPLRLVPNTDPKTMGDLSRAHGPLRTSPEVVIRTARLAVMQYNDPARIKEALTSRYDSETLKAAKTGLAQVFAERGLLGRFYIEASDFPECAQGGKAVEFAQKTASTARFVVAKKACGNCTHHTGTPDGTHHCSVFHKEIQIQVPYSQELADQVENLQRAKGKVVQASTLDPKERIRAAFLAPKATSEAQQFSGQTQYKPPSTVTPERAKSGLIAASALVKKNREIELEKTAELKARPIVAFLRREMIKGRSQEEIVQSLRLAFDLNDLKATAPQWKPLVDHLGLYGVVYSTQESFDECREGADFLAKHGSTIKAIVAGKKCSSCIFSQIGRCMMYGRKLVASPDEVFTPEVVKAVVDEHRTACRLPWNADRLDWGTTPVAALKAIHKAASGPQPAPGASTRLAIETQFAGAGHQYKANTLAIRDIVRAASRYMNEGMYGEDLANLMKSRFDPRDLWAAKDELRKVFAEQGLQGIRYIDPTIYEDYGKGCKEAGRLHRSRLVPYVKMGSKCASCVLRDPTGACSVLAKPLVTEPPYVDKLAEQRAILASGKASEVSYESIMNNGLSMMAEYQLQHQEPGDIEMKSTSKDPISIEFGGTNIDL